MVTVVYHKGRSASTDLDEDTEDHEDGELNEQTNEIKIFTQNFCSTIASSGGFGRVYKRETANGVQVAITLHSSRIGETDLNPGVSMLRTAYIRILIKLFGFFFDTSINSLAYDFMENGSLDRFLSDNNGSIDWKKCYHIAVGTAKGLSYLHQYCDQLVIYYDIKPNNILFDSNFCRGVANSGLVELYDRNVNLAPELSSSFETICKYDVYLFGMMFTIVVTRNGELYIEKLQLPQHAWDIESRQLERGSEETNREYAKRILMIALWFVEHIPEDSPSMSTAETIVEGEMENMEPLYLPSLASSDKDSEVSITSVRNLRIVGETTSTNNHDLSYTEIFTPVMERFEF
ncbi:hypothetical protein AQUCO_01000739v1 [Aquilegia coerulea]|uniref:Protein kinase domain-containing protein n=1 Tax=Aquilegia coerulea TaxID=218851 RepID=A0A2G5EBI9_AQUCA|nr:hypothetical protein AQUCO_01000739v1 [Aquilegia coerulea]